MMKLAITDACIFIELHLLRLHAPFFKLDIEIHTSVDVFNELFPEQQELLKAYEVNQKLFIHSLTNADRHAVMSTSYPAALSENDKSVLYLALKLEAMVLSSDKAVRKQAKKQASEVHGMFWIFDRLVEQGLLSKADASMKLRQMTAGNIIYQNNQELLREMKVRLAIWDKL